jgi:hypothetical protein
MAYFETVINCRKFMGNYKHLSLSQKWVDGHNILMTYYNEIF